jgi:hypothetical protein
MGVMVMIMMVIMNVMIMKMVMIIMMVIMNVMVMIIVLIMKMIMKMEMVMIMKVKISNSNGNIIIIELISTVSSQNSLYISKYFFKMRTGVVAHSHYIYSFSLNPLTSVMLTQLCLKPRVCAKIFQ